MTDKVMIYKIMTKKVISCSPEDTVDKVASKMVKNHIGVLVVMNGTGGLVGIVTERDIIKKVVSKKLSVIDTKVKSVMSKNVITGELNMTDIEVATLFSKKHIKKLPILDKGKVVGMITQTDLMKVLSLKWAL